MPLAIKALFFDVFGTLVDWRTSVARETQALLAPRGYALDWLAMADAWRGEYQGAMEEVRAGRIPFCKLDVLHRRNLERILPRFGVASLGDDVLHDLNLAWHRLDAWSEVPPALARLKRRYLLAPVSNGNISLMVDLARRNDFPWDAVLGAEIAGDYKPKPGVYLAAAEAFDLAAHECMMVAAHSSDLKAAAAPGLRTAHIARPNESGPGRARASPASPSILPPGTSCILPSNSALERFPGRRRDNKAPCPRRARARRAAAVKCRGTIDVRRRSSLQFGASAAQRISRLSGSSSSGWLSSECSLFTIASSIIGGDVNHDGPNRT